jgi:radical SAM protein with 4Fe4S-binding SPASM domain
MATVALKKIFEPSDPSFLDMRSPCGAGCGQLAYMHDGSVYTCDEARMLGSDAFKLGNINTDSYADLMRSRRMQAVVFASCIDGLYCDYCAYKPYCGVCPVINWQECSSLYAQPNKAMMCKMNKGMLDALFTELADVRKNRVLKGWIGLV